MRGWSISAWNGGAQCVTRLLRWPVVPGGRRKDGDWLGPAFGGKHFVQAISLDQKGRPRPEIARRWVRRLAAAVRAEDREALVTVGLVDWSLDRPGLTSGFVPAEIAPEVDFLCVHLYPEAGKVDEALKTLSRGERLCVSLCYGADWSHGEAAEALNIPIGTVKSHVKRGLDKLRARLARPEEGARREAHG